MVKARNSPYLLERVKGIEPSSQAWEAQILPLNHCHSLSAILISPTAESALWAVKGKRRLAFVGHLIHKMNPPHADPMPAQSQPGGPTCLPFPAAPMPATAKRTAARRVFAEKALRRRCSSVEDPPGLLSAAYGSYRAADKLHHSPKRPTNQVFTTWVSNA